MLGTVLLWLAVRLVRAREPWKKTVHYALLGFAGGVGWWTSPLVVYQIPRRGRGVVLRERPSAIWKGATMSVPAFFIGAAPFSYTYARDPYSDVLSMGGGYALRNVPEGLYLLFVERLPQYLAGTFPRRPSPSCTGSARSSTPGPWPSSSGTSADHSARGILERCRHLPDLLPRLHAPVRRKPPHQAKRSDVPDPLSALLRWPSASGSGLAPSLEAGGRGGLSALFLVHGWETVSWVVAYAPRAEASTQGHVTSS